MPEHIRNRGSRLSPRELRRRRRKHQLIFRTIAAAAAVLILAVTGWELRRFLVSRRTAAVTEPVFVEEKKVWEPPEYDVQLLEVNEYSRPGLPLERVTGIVVHYTANPGTTAQQNRDYFQGLSLSHETYASSHFVVGIGGELIQCIPCNEIAYASKNRNEDTISIECCIPDETGKFADETYRTLVHLTAWLMGRYDLEPEDVIRHYDVTGKNCPKYYVEHPDAWEKFKQDVCNYIEQNGSFAEVSVQP